MELIEEIIEIIRENPNDCSLGEEIREWYEEKVETGEIESKKRTSVGLLRNTI